MVIPKAALAMTLAGFAAISHADVTYDFNSGLQGFTGDGGLPAVSWVATGGVGNTGYLQMIDLAGGQMLAVSPLLGNQSNLFGGSFSFDYNAIALQNNNSYIPNNPFGTVTIYAGSSYVTADLIQNISQAGNIIGTGWHTASLGLTNALWTGNSSLSSVLGNVTKITIDTEYNYTQKWADEIVGIDNVAVTAVPEPQAALLMVAGLAGVGLFTRRRRG